MASSDSENDDLFINNLLGLGNESVPAFDSNSVNDAVARLERGLSAQIASHGPFVCSRCNRSFSLKHNLTKHVKNVDCKTSAKSKIEPKACPVCKKLFARTFSLNRHMKTHEAHERPGAAKKTNHFCNGCRKTFVNSGNLNKHIKDGRCKHVCGHCSETVKSVNGMRLHLQEHMDQEFLTISQLRALRKQLKYFESKEHTPTPGPSADLTPPDRSRNSLLSPPSSSSSSRQQ